MTTSRNNTIMSWMAYTDFLSRLRIAAGILLPLNTRTLLLYPGGRDCIGAAGVDAYEIGSKKVEIAISSCARYNSNMSEISMHEKMFVYGGTRKWE